jgi:hypothetical protein
MTSAPAPTPVQTTANMGGYSSPSGAMMSKSAAPSASASTITAVGFPADTSQAPPVTSTGVIRVGLAGQSSQLSSVLTPVVLAVLFALACAAGFLLHRRRRNSAGSHN